jgi:polar amino acid transport system substrate-binding protein
MKRALALFLTAIFALALLAGCSSPAASGGEDTSLEDILSKGYFIVGLDDAFPPMGYRDAEGNIVGFDIDLAKAVAEQMGIEVKFQPVVWENIAFEVANGNVDVIWNGCTITEARKESFDFSEPYMENAQVVIVLDDAPYQTLADLAGKQIGVQDGSSAQLAIENNKDFASSIKGITGYPTNDKALLDLVAGRVDAVVADVTVYGYYYGIEPNVYRRLDEELGAEEFGIAFAKDADAFREALQEALNEVIANGTAKEISEKWFGYDVTAK